MASAISATPEGGNYAPGEQISISLTADPPVEGVNVVEFTLTAENMTISDYTPPDGATWAVVKPGCENSYHTESTVCVILGKSADISQGELLGTITATVSNEGSAKLVPLDGSYYTDGQELYAITNIVADYTVLDSLPQTNNTGIDQIVPDEYLPILVGGIVLFVLLILFLLAFMIVGKSKGAKTAFNSLVVFGGVAVSVGAVYTITNTQQTAPDETEAAVQIENTHKLNVMFIGYNPTEGDRDIASTYYSGQMGGRPAREFEQSVFDGMKAAYNNLSDGKIQFTLKRHMSITDFPTYNGQTKFDVDDYAKCVWGNPNFEPSFCEGFKQTFEYANFIRQYDLCNIIEQDDIDEIWMVSPPYILAWENFMFGPTDGFGVNGPAFKISECGKHIIVTNGTYDRPGTLMHNVAHRVEATMRTITAYWNTAETQKHWENFSAVSRYHGANPSSAYCGNGHFAFNSTGDYDYGQTTAGTSICPDWKNFPNYKGTTEQGNCTIWNCNDADWQVHWLGSMPSNTGETLIKAKNGQNIAHKNDWWYYFLHPENVINYPEYAITCESFTYSDWGTCNDGTQTRTITASLPAGCRDGTPEPLAQDCEVPVVECTGFEYSDWGACVDGFESRTILDMVPPNCEGGFLEPTLKRPCTTTCTEFNYSDWGACVDGKQNRTLTSSLPDGCSGGSPVTVRDCDSEPDPEVCQDFTYSEWSSCQDGSQTRTILSQAPAGCTGGQPDDLTRSCRQTCTGYEYSDWGQCVNGTQTRSITSSTPNGCSGGSTESLTRSCTQSCSSFTYSAWSTCQAGKQTRTITNKAPSGCTGGTPGVLTRSCSIACSAYTYSNWGPCQNGTQTRQVTNSSPNGCTGGTPPVTQRSCQTTCSSFTYSSWGECLNGTQKRLITGQYPSGCTGGSPEPLVKACQSTTTCSSFEYSDWGECINGTQTRGIAFSSPSGCSDGNPQLSRSCQSSSNYPTPVAVSTGVPVQTNQPGVTTTVTPTVAFTPLPETSEPIVCLAIDSDDDGRFTIIDLARLLKQYNRGCLPAVQQYSCGYSDIDNNGVFDQDDVSEVTLGLNAVSCR